MKGRVGLGAMRRSKWIQAQYFSKVWTGHHKLCVRKPFSHGKLKKVHMLSTLKYNCIPVHCQMSIKHIYLSEISDNILRVLQAQVCPLSAVFPFLGSPIGLSLKLYHWESEDPQEGEAAIGKDKIAQMSPTIYPS